MPPLIKLFSRELKKSHAIYLGSDFIFVTRIESADYLRYVNSDFEFSSADLNERMKLYARFAKSQPAAESKSPSREMCRIINSCWSRSSLTMYN